MQVQETAAIVTGAASGLGAATAAALAAKGATVFGLDLPDAAADAAKSDGVTYVGADVTDAEQVRAAVERSARPPTPPRRAASCGLTLPAARDLAQYGIRVLTIAPGIVETPRLATVSDEFRAGLASGIPFPQRLGRPEEYADLALFLVTHDYLNGEVVRMDGALRMAPR